MRVSGRKLTARSWDSYKDTMYAVLDAVKPERVFEWGSGFSTVLLAMYPSVRSVETVEHKENWFNVTVARTRGMDVAVHFVPRLKEYAHIKTDHEKYDFIFVDGPRRAHCIKRARGMLKEGGVVMVHDAERHWYRRAIEAYKHYLYTDEGSTATMTDSDGTFARIRERALLI